jgi:eukaryotic-like serine/threonine-protein kinase
MRITRLLFTFVKYVLLIVSLMMVGALSTFLTLRFFTSGDEAVVPDLSGKDPVEAIRILRNSGLSLKILPQKRFNDKIPADKIVAQRPDPKTKIKQGRSVEVYISLGPEKTIVPEVIGQTMRVATMTLEQRGLHQGKVIYVTDPAAQADQILAQYPDAGTELTGARAVNLLVNNMVQSNEYYVMPDVIGKQLSEVQDYFRDVGLRMSAAQAVDYPGISPNTVVKQTPPAGYKVSKDSYIGLYYSK